MPFTIEQKIKGRIYVYEVESYWDKEKKKTRQRRKYLGPKEKLYKPRQEKKRPEVVSKSYGDIYLINYLYKELGVETILTNIFGNDTSLIKNLSAFFLCEGDPGYLYSYWHDDHFMKEGVSLSSSTIASLYHSLGEREKLEFMEQWSNKVNPTQGIFYDITSISSYCNNIDYVEWGYNRDKETLPQINLGITTCHKTSLPIYYNIYPGSICDVSTLKNTMNMFDIFKLKDITLVLDRGFCSKKNMLEMHNSNYSFVQPISLSFNIAKKFVEKYFESIQNPKHMFAYKDRTMYHVLDKIDFSGVELDAHIFFDEYKALEFKNNVWCLVLKESKIMEAKFTDEEEAREYIEDNILAKLRPYFKYVPETGKIVRDDSILQKNYIKSGLVIMVSNIENIDAESILELYKNRNIVEEGICVFKNSLDGGRLRAHSSKTAEGRIFIKFLAMIINAKIMQVIKGHKKLKSYSVKELLLELRKLKVNTFDESSHFVTEISKKQKIIYNAFGINQENISKLYQFS